MSEIVRCVYLNSELYVFRISVAESYRNKIGNIKGIQENLKTEYTVRKVFYKLK